MPVADHIQAQALLPVLRQDLRLLDSNPERSGQPSWLLYDPARNRYFKMGQRAFAMLRHWQPGLPVPALQEILSRQGLDIVAEEIAALIRFLRNNNLVAITTPIEIDTLASSSVNASSSFWRWLFHNYLFFRIPLFRPDRFLDRTLPFTAALFSPWVWPLVLLFGLMGLFLASRQWAEFTTTFLYFFDLQGLIIFGLTTIIVKALHELGHAYTAKRLGCRVPVMGVAFMALYPMLYTDTTDAWRIPSGRQRMQIAMAGIKVELAIACLALCAWGFLQDGVLRSAAWFLASVSWLSSLAVNLSPFMRFDGYYILADWLGEENLQPRSFALARWSLRKLLFGIEDPPPEILPPRRHWLFIGYAMAVWVYRLFIFLGIALMVYHLAFKALGIVLFAVEIGWFILLPLWQEIRIWWHKRASMRRSIRPWVTCSLVMGLLLLLFLPWQGSLVIPAVWKASQHSLVFPPEDGQLHTLLVANGQTVHKGEPLFQIDVPALHHDQQVLDIDQQLLDALFERHPGSARELKALSVLKMRRSELQARQQAAQERQDRLLVRAPFSGQVEISDPKWPGEWLAHNLPLLSVHEPGPGRVVAYVEEIHLHRIDSGLNGYFVAQESALSRLNVRLVSISSAAIADLKDPLLASANGGPIAVRPHDSQGLRPDQGIYRLEFAIESKESECTKIIPGVVRLHCRPSSLARRLWNAAVAVLIRELSL